MTDETQRPDVPVAPPHPGEVSPTPTKAPTRKPQPRPDREDKSPANPFRSDPTSRAAAYRSDPQRRSDSSRGSAANHIEKVVSINRVAKVVKGGRRFSFTALVVVGDGDGQVGVGYGKAKEVPAAIAKGVEEAKRNMFHVPRIRGTIPHPVLGERAAGAVMLRPASPGTGLIAGGAVRAVLEAAGVHDVLTKSLRSSNALNVVQATVAALQKLESPEDVAIRRGLPVEAVAPAALLRSAARA